jgi:hypothetical protein
MSQGNTQLVSPPDLSSPEDVDLAVADFQSEDDVEPFRGDRPVDVEEMHGQHGWGLRVQEPRHDVSWLASAPAVSAAA